MIIQNVIDYVTSKMGSSEMDYGNRIIEYLETLKTPKPITMYKKIYKYFNKYSSLIKWVNKFTANDDLRKVLKTEGIKYFLIHTKYRVIYEKPKPIVRIVDQLEDNTNYKALCNIMYFCTIGTILTGKQIKNTIPFDLSPNQDISCFFIKTK